MKTPRPFCFNTYNIYWNADKSMLLYPKTSFTQEPWGKYLKGKVNNHYCKLGFVDVLDEEKRSINLDIGKSIFDKLDFQNPD